MSVVITAAAVQCSYFVDIGVYQLRVIIVVLAASALASDSMHIIFIGANMPHWCRVPELVDLPHDVQKRVAIPSLTSDGRQFSSCEMYSLDYGAFNRSQFYSWNRSLMVSNDTPVVACSRWTYDQTQFVSTIVSEVRSPSLF